MRLEAQFSSQCRKNSFLGFQRLEAPSGQRGALGMLNRVFDAPLPIGVRHAGRVGDDAVMGQHRAVDRIELRFVQIGREDAFLQVVEDGITDHPAKISKCLFVKLRPDLLAGFPDHAPEAAPRIAQRHHEQAGPAISAALGIDRRRALAIVDLSFLAGKEFKTIKLLWIAVSQRAHKPLDAPVAGRKAKLIDQVLVNRWRIPFQADLVFDPRPMRFAGRPGQAAGDRRSRYSRSRWSGWRNLVLRACRAGGHLPGGICLRTIPLCLVTSYRLAIDPRQPLNLALAGVAIKYGALQMCLQDVQLPVPLAV